MSATAAKTIADLDDDEIERRAAELVLFVGADEAARIHWRRRIAVDKDGATLIELKLPTVPAGLIAGSFPGYRDLPWMIAGAMDAVTAYLPLAAAVPLLTGPDPDNPEAEIARRQKLYADYVAAQEVAAEARIAHAREQREKERQHKADRPKRRKALKHTAKLLYLAAAQGSMTVPAALVMLAKLSTEKFSDYELNLPPKTFEPDLAP
jgi:hypothetical protein